jgi:hypothetical protein
MRVSTGWFFTVLIYSDILDLRNFYETLFLLDMLCVKYIWDLYHITWNPMNRLQMSSALFFQNGDDTPGLWQISSAT